MVDGTSWNEENPRPLPDGKDYHFFLSHKKHHSKLGMQPAQLAMQLKDQLELKGFIGFFDVDGLTKISEEMLESCVLRSCAVIVLLNDETCASTWCKFEWVIAQRGEIPGKCVVDTQHFGKDTILDYVLSGKGTALPSQVVDWLLKFQWEDFVDKYRKQLLTELSMFLTTVLEDMSPTASKMGKEAPPSLDELADSLDAVLPGQAA